MADWIWNAAEGKGITDIEIDILNGTVNPRELQIQPIVVQLSRLRETITATLKSNDFPTDFIVDAKFQIYISQSQKSLRLMSCQAILTDKDGRTYQGKTYTERAYEPPF